MVASDDQALVLYGKEIFHADNVFDDKLLVLKKNDSQSNAKRRDSRKECEEEGQEEEP